MNPAQAIAAAAALGLERLDAQLLVLHALGRPQGDRAWLLAHDQDALDEPARRLFTGLLERRAAGEPLAYLVGRKEFFALELGVDRRVLVPRPETETLVEWAIDICHSGPDPQSRAWIPGQARDDRLRIIDLGTGSGAIALAIKAHCPGIAVEAVDASEDALEVARDNARRLSLQVEFRHGSWLEGSHGRYDLVVSNPPYIAERDPHLSALKHEPPGALASGPDGLSDIRAIVAQAPARLNPGGWLLLEHGYDQADAVRGLLTAGGFSQVAGRTDLAGIQRCCGGQWLELG